MKSLIKKELLGHYLVALVWLVFFSLIRWQWDLNLVWLWIGGLVGTMLLDLDQVFYALLLYPEEKAKEFWKKRQFWKLLVYLGETYQQRKKLPFHNAVFQVFWLVFCFWVLVSTSGLFTKGVVMAMNLHLLKDEVHLLLKGREEELKSWLFWPVKREVGFGEQKVFVGAMGLGFLILNLFFV